VNGSKILVLGLAYKAGTADTRESPSRKVIELLTKRGAQVSLYDPWVGEKLYPVPAWNRLVPIREFDLVVLLTNHDEFTDELVSTATRVFDTRDHFALATNIERL
jgi:UDP-N-acetyl-D-glucosamine dehydrogenase